MPELGTFEPGEYQMLDYTKQRRSFRVFYGEVTALSLPGLLTALGDFTTAVDNITIGTIAKTNFSIVETVISNTPPTDKGAQIGSRLLVQYQDSVTEKPYSFNIPTIDYSKLNFVPGGGNAVIFSGAGASAEIAAFVTKFQALAKSPDNDANSVVITGMRYNSGKE